MLIIPGRIACSQRFLGHRGRHAALIQFTQHRPPAHGAQSTPVAQKNLREAPVIHETLRLRLCQGRLYILGGVPAAPKILYNLMNRAFPNAQEAQQVGLQTPATR